MELDHEADEAESDNSGLERLDNAEMDAQFAVEVCAIVCRYCPSSIKI